jgi:hypothetical protein
MTAQELAQQILDIAQRALEKEIRTAVYIGDISSEGEARAGLEAIVKLCREGLHPEAYKQYEKKQKSERDKGHGPLVEPAPDAFPLHYQSPYIQGEVSHATTSKD